MVVFSGAGISTDSGISDYRSKGGLWDRFVPVTFQEFIADESKRIQYWQRKLELYESLKDACPNAGHEAIVTLERSGALKGIITQNIDGLHQQAGSDPALVYEIHGTNRETICLSCGDIQPWQQVYQRLQLGEGAPLCELCQGLLKPNTISFGQNLNREILDKSVQLASECDLMIAVGSTLLVEPAASLPRLAKKNGAAVVIITKSETPLDHLADLKFSESASEILSQAVQLVK